MLKTRKYITSIGHSIPGPGRLLEATMELGSNDSMSPKDWPYYKQAMQDRELMVLITESEYLRLKALEPPVDDWAEHARTW